MNISHTSPPSLSAELLSVIDTAISEGKPFEEVRAMYQSMKAVIPAQDPAGALTKVEVYDSPARL